MNIADVSAIVRRAVMECLPPHASHQVAPEELTELFYSPKATEIKEEIVLAGRKLWERQYVDGNGGNISARISPGYVICTPTLRSKGDLRIDDLSLVDLENNQRCGNHPQTSEILLHLEIYKAVPRAKAVIHCHPPYATAHAIAGVIPQGNLVPEQEVFIGPVELTPYETPGTEAFAKTVVPVVRQHNTILLANHGVVCWADTVTHAEWYVEVIDTYCKTVMIASQLKSPLVEIPPDKIRDLLEIKKKLGLPDVRLPLEPESVPHGLIEMDLSMTSGEYISASPEEIERLISSLTSQVMDFLEKGAYARQS